jgi:hypothetical protein
MKGSILTILIILIVLFSAKGQEGVSEELRFSHRFHFDFPAVEFTGVLSTDSCYYVTGIVADSVFPYKTGNLFARFSFDGTPSLTQFLRDTFKTYETWRGSLAKTPNGKLADIGYSIDSMMRRLIIIYEPTTGDTIKTLSFIHPYYPDESYNLIRDFKVLEDGFLTVSNFQSPVGVNNNDILVTKIDFEGEIIWEHEHGIWSKDDSPDNIIVTDNGYIIASIRDNTNTGDNSEAYNHIFKSDWNGNHIWSYFSPYGELRGKEGRAIRTNDNGVLVITGNGGIIGNQWRFHNYVFKLDSNQQVEWDVYVRDSLEAISYNNQLTSAVELEDGSGYVVAGNLIEGVPDSLYFNGVLAKISPDGDLLWKRYYQHLVSMKTRHYINDMDVAPDGGFIMVGEVRDSVNAPRQQGWLLKVDEYGCLVPNCHLLDTIVSASSIEIDTPALLLYPNPAQEELRVYVKGQQHNHYHFRIVDHTGRIWQEFESPLSETTFVLDVQQWVSGVYYLQCFGDGVLLRTDSFVVSQ